MVEKADLLHHIPRVKLGVVLVLTLAFTVVLLGASHLTHSLTLRIEAYHALYNLLSLIGCLLTMKLCSGPQSLHNTFGWARLEVLSMLTTQIFLTALCFSVATETIQTAVHAGHQDAMHHPLSVMALGAVGWSLNALVFCLIGGLVVVVLCAAVVHWDNGGTVALYIDPALAVTSVALLMWFSYPYGKECCHILLQTIPGHIDVENFQARILEEFPAIVNIHHLHIWTFTPSKVVATAHVVFTSPRVYLSTQGSLKQFFLDEGVTKVTLQPEYMTRQPGPSPHDAVCLLRCQHQDCHERECCRSCTHHPLLTSVTSHSEGVSTGHHDKERLSTGHHDKERLSITQHTERGHLLTENTV
ncbi:Zinc transporter 1-like 2 [Homarus americanus]|uniref:Zinc transporter 1-like 2 n=1 Tax=Homarus americanus TaxID=6706 RepID=A0A8J5K4L9_HOMAM|nr:Zinc transporter 1-like 2 [Homarus americanus]